MYVIRNQKTREILYIDPVEQNSTLKEKDVYPDFDPKTMEIGWSRSDELPEHFRIGKDRQIIELSLEEQISEGIVVLQTTQKIQNNVICDKTLQEQVDEGLIELQPFEKIVDNQIVEKTLEEQIREGLIELLPSEKIVRNEIVTKTVEEELAEGLITIDAPFEYISELEVRRRPVEELVEKRLLKTVAQCEKALRLLSIMVEEAIAKQYLPSYEVKLTKDYLMWVEAGKPKSDENAQKYLTMQVYVENVKRKYRPLRDRIKKIMDDLQNPEKPRKPKATRRSKTTQKSKTPRKSKTRLKTKRSRKMSKAATGSRA